MLFRSIKDTCIKLGRRRGMSEYDSVELVPDIGGGSYDYSIGDVYGRSLGYKRMIIYA